MTAGQRIRRIMSEERRRTMEAIDAMPWPEDAKADIPPLWAAIQTAVNAHVQAADRVFDSRVMVTTLRLSADEMERVASRLKAEGLQP
jgi:hypothetical protein